MTKIILITISTLLTGCCRVPLGDPTKEPETEVLVSAYYGRSEAEVDAQRIREGW